MGSILQLNRFRPNTFMLDVVRWLKIRIKCAEFYSKTENWRSTRQPNCKQLQYVSEGQPYRLRNANDFRLRREDTSGMPKLLYYKGLNMYNKMPNYLMNEKNINVFRKKKFGNFVKNNSS